MSTRTIRECALETFKSPMKALEEFIAISPDASPVAKQAIIWALRQTEHLSKEVAVSIPFGPPTHDDPRPIDEQIAFGVHGMNSCGGRTRIDLFLAGMGRHRRMSSHCGRYVNGRFDSKAGGYTFWIAQDMYGWGGTDQYEHLALDSVAIQKVELPK